MRSRTGCTSSRYGEHTLDPVVGETNDARVNNMWLDPIGKTEVYAALENAATGPVAEGSVGAVRHQAFGWKGGIGTSSRVLPSELGRLHRGRRWCRPTSAARCR